MDSPFTPPDLGKHPRNPILAWSATYWACVELKDEITAPLCKEKPTFRDSAAHPSNSKKHCTQPIPLDVLTLTSDTWVNKPVLKWKLTLQSFPALLIHQSINSQSLRVSQMSSNGSIPRFCLLCLSEEPPMVSFYPS